MSPELRFAHWLRGYMDARRIGQTAIEGLTGQDCSRIYAELQFATGDMVRLGGGMRELTPSDMIGQVYGGTADEIMARQRENDRQLFKSFTAQGQTIPLAEQQRVEHEQKQRAALHQRRDPDCPAHDTRCNAQECAVQNLGGGYGVPRGVR